MRYDYIVIKLTDHGTMAPEETQQARFDVAGQQGYALVAIAEGHAYLQKTILEPHELP